jgi:tetratricopeptide (TPR) repeat protein
MLTRNVPGRLSGEVSLQNVTLRGGGVVWLAVWLCCLAMETAAVAQASGGALDEKIAGKLEKIHAAERGQLALTQRQVGILWCLVAIDYDDGMDYSRAEDAYGRSLVILGGIPAAAKDYARLLDHLGTMYLITQRLDEAETVRKKALTQYQKLGDRADIAVSEEMLAEALLMRRRFKDAEREAADALRILDADPKAADKFDLASTLITLTYARCLRKDCAQGEKDADRAVMLARSYFEPNSLLSGQALFALGFAKERLGQAKEAEAAMLEGLQIMKMHLPASDRRVTGSLWQYRNFLVEMHRKAEADLIEREVASSRDQHPSCKGCTVNVKALNGLR